jgi:fatty acid desaturase
MDSISPTEFGRLRWTFYLTLLAWPVFLFLLPYAVTAWGWWSIALMVFPGLYLFTGVGYCMHECWHKYVPGLPHKLFYNLYAWMLLTDPQMYGALHGHHHSDVNTWEDREFHPLGDISRKPWRGLYHLLEIIFGVAFVVVVSALVVPGLPQYREHYRFRRLLVSILIWTLFLGGLGWLSHQVLGAGVVHIVLAYLGLYGLGSMLLHHSQLVEHGNLITAGDWNQRNLKTRNLRRRTWIEKLFLFLTHNDSHEHVLHHTQVRVDSRPFPGRWPLPPQAVIISWRDYLGILGDMLAGKESAK